MKGSKETSINAISPSQDPWHNTTHPTTVSIAFPSSPASPLLNHPNTTPTSSCLLPHLPILFYYHQPLLPTHLISQPKAQLGLAGCVGPRFPPHSIPPTPQHHEDVFHRPNATSLAGATPSKVSPEGGIIKEGVPKGGRTPCTVSPSNGCIPRQMHHNQDVPEGGCTPRTVSPSGSVTPRGVSVSDTCSPRTHVLLQEGALQRRSSIRRVEPMWGALQAGCISRGASLLGSCTLQAGAAPRRVPPALRYTL